MSVLVTGDAGQSPIIWWIGLYTKYSAAPHIGDRYLLGNVSRALVTGAAASVVVRDTISV